MYVSDRLPTIAFVAALAWFTWQALRLALEKHFSIDEFQYAHAAWLVAHGQVPYRDFFEVHFPLVYQVLAPVFLIAGDNPGAVLGLRAGMLVFLTLACGAAALANREQGRFAMLAAPAVSFVDDVEGRVSEGLAQERAPDAARAVQPDAQRHSSILMRPSNYRGETELAGGRGQEPRAAAHSLEKARQAIEESRQAAQTRAPMQEHLRAQIHGQEPEPASQPAEPTADNLEHDLARILDRP